MIIESQLDFKREYSHFINLKSEYMPDNESNFRDSTHPPLSLRMTITTKKWYWLYETMSARVGGTLPDLILLDQFLKPCTREYTDSASYELGFGRLSVISTLSYARAQARRVERPLY